MGRIVAIEHVTIDGVMQGPARPDEDRRDGFAHGGWGVAAGSDPAIQKVIGARMGSLWSLLVGRVTYEDLYGFWTRQPPNPMSDALDRVEKFVASTTLTEPLPWRNSRLLKGDAVDAIDDLKRKHDKTLVIFGSGVLVRSLMRRDLIDEYVLQIHPLVLGQGRRLFADTDAFAKLELVESTATGTGVVIAIWRLASSPPSS
jgi:dihydrofolate reductase